MLPVAAKLSQLETFIAVYRVCRPPEEVGTSNGQIVCEQERADVADFPVSQISDAKFVLKTPVLTR